DEGKAVMEMVEEDGFYNVLIKSIYVTILSTYCLTITIGRIYCGMHSITDVLAGVCIGILSWWTQWGWQNNIEELILNDSLLVPIGIIFIGIFTIYIFPEPVDDCPCFEDCVAFIGVLVGMIFGSWRHAKSSYSLHGSGVANIPYDYNIIGFPISIARIIFGVIILFLWRFFSKKILRFILSPIIKLKSGINSVTKNKSVVIVKKLSFRNDIDVAVKFIVYAELELEFNYLVDLKDYNDQKIRACIDAKHFGNYMRFANHKDKNQNGGQQYVMHNGIWHVLYLAQAHIKANEQIFVNYGPGYWENKKKYEF
ncbi:14755_t:CDS:2, partial [Entrophospora sp. SA101]